MKRRVYTILLVLIILFIVMITYNYFFVYHMTIVGDENQIINVHSKFKDQGVIVKYRGNKIKKYITESNVNIDKLGTYLVKYKVGKTSIKRYVKVVDKESPVIELKGDKQIDINYKDEYKELGFSVNDNYDGDITDKVVVNGEVDTNKLGTYTLKYVITDSNNNSSYIERIVNVKDLKKPEITFNNNKNTYAIKGKKIKLNDFKAIDNYDGDITDKVVINEKVNFNKVKKYDVTYTVEDSNNNKTTVTRTINVQEKNTRGIPVLMYHWFYDDTKGEKPGPVNSHNYISKTNIEKQVKYLKENNFYFPTWQELIDYIDGKIDLPEKSVIITDDDCVKSFFRVAYPVFKKYEVPVTSFCITSKNIWKKYDKEEYLDFESHTDNLHQRICNTYWDGAVMCKSYDEIYEDIKKSVSKIKNTYAFAYPFGHYNDNTIKALKENDIKLAFTIHDGRVKRGSDKYKLPRVRISAGTSLESFKYLVN